MPKTVIEVDVIDGKFKAFAEAFAAFQKQIEEAKKKMEGLGGVFNTIGQKGKNALNGIKKELEGLKKAAADVLPAMYKLGTTIAEIAKSAFDITKNILKWMAFGVAGTVAAGFGFGALGSRAVSTQTSASGYGVSSGSLRAAKVAYGQMGLDVEGLLSTIAQAKNDPSFGAAFQQFGVQDSSNMSTMDIFNQILRGGKSKIDVKNLGQMREIAKLGINPLDINKIQAQSAGDIESAIAKQKKLAPTYETNERGWAAFMETLAGAGEKIETSLIRNLTKLTPALSALANGLAGAIDKGLSSGEFQQWITKMAIGIVNFAKMLGTDEFQNSIKKFFKSLSNLVDGIEKIVNFLLHPIETTKTAAKEFFTGGTYLTEEQQKVVGKYQYQNVNPEMLRAYIGASKANMPDVFKDPKKFEEFVKNTAQTLSYETNKYKNEPMALLKALNATRFGEKAVEEAKAQNAGDIRRDSRMWDDEFMNRFAIAGDNAIKLIVDDNTSGNITLQAAKGATVTSKR